MRSSPKLREKKSSKRFPVGTRQPRMWSRRVSAFFGRFGMLTTRVFADAARIVAPPRLQLGAAPAGAAVRRRAAVASAAAEMGRPREERRERGMAATVSRPPDDSAG